MYDMCIIYVLYTLYTCLPENQDVQVLKVGKFSFHRIVTTWVLDFKCFLLDRERNRIMDLGLRTNKEEALTKGSRHFKEWLNHTPGTRQDQDFCKKKTRISQFQDLCHKKTKTGPLQQENQDITVSPMAFRASCIKFSKLSFHQIVTTWILDKCSLLSRGRNKSRNMNMGLAFRTKKGQA